MVKVLGPTAPRQRFQRLKYVGQLYRMRDELEQWQHAYLLKGKDERSVALEEVLVAIDVALSKFSDFWKVLGS